MATPMTASVLLSALKAEGVKVVEYKDWRDHQRDEETGKPFGPVNGVVIHHTVTEGTQNSVDICYDGYSSLPGPLCHGVIDKKGVVYLISAGRSNHAGSGDPDVWAAARDESYGDYPPAPNENTMDGNDVFYGFECVNLGDGEDPWPDVQVEAMVKASAAICRHYGWSAKSVIGHKEWQLGKIDPKGIDMKDFRDKVQAVIDGGASSPSDSGDKPKPKPVYAPFPGRGFFKLGKRSGLITAMGKRLVANGYKGYKVGPGPEFTAADKAAVRWFQKKQGWTGSDADGIPGPKTWALLKVPKS